ncbi:MAG: glycosyltransferase [Armatimonadetes bacterium]|nr:glycosyltransferase [Armatimonadota bacterium]
MKILLAANAPWASTAYGQQGASLARRLRDDGHKVVYYCNFGLSGGVQEWEGIMCLPTGEGGYVDPIIKGHIRYTQPDLLLSFHDLWPLAKTDIPAFIRGEHIPWAAWFPIDALPPSHDNMKVLTQVDYPITLANFAEEALKEHGFTTTVIPHGIEKHFGFTANGRREFRRHLQVPQDAFLFGSVGRNAYFPGRKGFDRLMRAFTEMPEDCYLYIHATTNSEHGSVALPQIAEFYGIQDRVMFADDYNGVMGYSAVGMNSLYSALDCYVQPTLGEGFGIPVIEAQACGVVVIATDCTSMPELLCPEASQLVAPATELFVPDLSHRALIDIPKLVDAMREIYDIKQSDPNGFTAMKGRVGLWANGWDWDTIYADHWRPLLATIEKEIAKAPPRDWHRGGGLVFEHEGRMRKQDSTLRSPAVKKELDVLETLAHPNIIPVLDSGQAEDGTWWFDMPKLRPLRDFDPASLPGAAILAGVRAGLEYLHERGIAHRDVCPENIVLGDNLEPYLIDFEWAHPCDGEIGTDCVDFEPWACLGKAVSVVQYGVAERGYHALMQHLRGIDLSEKTHGYKGVPYQQIDGVGERDCQIRWDIMKPDVADKSVLDVGCNLGWFVGKSLDEGAESALGVDNDRAVIESARALDSGGEFLCLDIEKQEHPLHDGDGISTFGRHFNIAFCLSTLQHIKNPDAVLRDLTQIADEIYIEVPSRFVTDYMASVLSNGELLGESERGRPIYRVKVREMVPA